MNYLNKDNLPLLIGILVAAMAMVIAVVLVVRHTHKTADGRKIERAIKKYSTAYEGAVIFSDGLDGFFFIDYLIRLPCRILALNLHKVEGYVFGGEHIELWTQVENNKSTKFKNPLTDVKLFVKHAALQSKYDGIMPRVLFDSSSKFPKGVPEGVLQLENLEESLAAWAAEQPAAATGKAWDQLSALLAESRERYNKETGRSLERP